MKRYLHAGSAGALVFGALMMFTAPSVAQELKQLNIMVPNNNTTTLYPVIVARELGWFEKAGLTINYLDADTTEQILELLRRLNSELGMTLLIVTHDPDVGQVARRQIRLERGKLIEAATARELEMRGSA